MTKFRFTTDPIEKKPDVVLRGGVEIEQGGLRFFLEDSRGVVTPAMLIHPDGSFDVFTNILDSIGIKKVQK